MATNVSLLAELLEIIFQENRELLLELNISNVIFANKREKPAIAELDVSPELHVNAERIIDGPASQFGLASLIFTVRDYLEVFEGTAESNRRVAEAISRFSQAHDSRELASVKEAFPDIFSIGTMAQEADKGTPEDIGTICAIFTTVMAKAHQDAGMGAAVLLAHLRQCDAVKSVSDDLINIDFADNITVDSALNMFSDAIQKLGLSQSFVNQILETYGPIPDEIGITARLSGGADSSSTAFGCAPIDRLLRDGLKKDVTVLLEGPAGVEKEILASLYLMEGLQRGGCAI
ncbi:MAG: hypothetical protein KKH41_09655 [Candidatus Thermoplasmatota archaeon]|nr:hypothetical protein [Euryarchaeota archaeon]MBU4032802.1 hypothetical protein [Candidatus Thermoplasmatota archaeon]MBU4071597.1 hypothetical protein [Candidatus Thermoplasmatota archaeon]MBU4144357.1 hypothetical protein [Candidatus Thermoplasmatota archaeon]MBU4592829.1 hypothetical protein [Candidatus Thermoplasmatota archaeon]